FSLMLLRALRKSGLWRWLLQDVPLGDDSIELGTVHLGHNPRIDLLLAEVLRRHHRKRREQAALEGGVILEQRLVGNESLVTLDRLEDRATDEPEFLGQRLCHLALDLGKGIERTVLEPRRVETLTSGLSGESMANLPGAGGGVDNWDLVGNACVDRHGVSSCSPGHTNITSRMMLS